MIHRHVIEKIIKYIDSQKEHPNVLIIDGARQVGKTTAILLALKQRTPYLEINLEKQKQFRKAIDETQSFEEFEKVLKREFNFSPGEGTLLYIDEANESLWLAAYIRQMKEDWKNQKVILSGSMMYRLFRNKKIRVPVGRIETLTVKPFSFKEYLLANEVTKSSLSKYGLFDLISDSEQIKKISSSDHQQLLSLLDHYLISGGMPEIAISYLSNSANINIRNKHLEYLEVLKEDFLKLFSEEYSNLFDRTFSSVANLLGQPFKKTSIIRNNPKLADNLLTVFEKWKLVLKCEQKTFDPNASNKFYPKRYLFDSGFAKTKREMGLPSISIIATLSSSQREPLGGLIEQVACNELLIEYHDLCGYRENNYEIDFIVKQQNITIPIECKASLKPNKNQYRSLDLFQKRYQNNKAVILSLAPFSKVQREKYVVYHIPIYAINAWQDIL
ncbi:MAG: AAA family ATPase [bacterium]|nr:AAA family ATPase [bacterium]MBU1918462.1 AAA family ATPase [bacterium]